MLEIIFVAVLLLSSITLIFIERGLTKKCSHFTDQLCILICHHHCNWCKLAYDPRLFLIVRFNITSFLKPKLQLFLKVSDESFKRFRNYRNCYRNVYITFTFPIITLPEPTGKYTVGTKAFHLIDKIEKKPLYQIIIEIVS